jgi:hypothetical protein
VTGDEQPDEQPDEQRDEQPGERGAQPVPAVEAALARLEELEARPVSEHPQVLAAVHRQLEDALVQPPGPVPGG